MINKLSNSFSVLSEIGSKDVDKVHVGFNQYVDVDTIQHFLYRDFPDDIQKVSNDVTDYVEATKQTPYTHRDQSVQDTHTSVYTASK